MRSSRGSSLLGSSENDSGTNEVPHHGHSSSGTGDGLYFESAWNWRTLLRAVSVRLSPFLPIRFGVAAWPTHRPISNGQLP